MRFRPTLRWRLTALYGGLFFVGGALLLALNYGIVSSSLPSDQIVFRTRVAPAPLPSQDPLLFVDGVPVGPDFIQDLPGRLRTSALQDLVRRSVVALVLVGIGSVVLGWWLAGRALRPVHRITETARRLSETNLHERIAMDGPDDELRELADTFDAMLERLDAAFASQRRFVANASHELRTPLAIMRTQLEVASTPEELADAVEVVQTVIDRSERLLEGLLVLARADGELVLTECDLGAALSAAAAEAPASGDVSVSVEADPAPVRGDAALLTHLARNLLDNACRYNVPGGTVSARSWQVGDEAVLTVANTGPAVADVGALFEPFRRGVADRTGSDTGAGLGLSIVRAVARAHGGDVVATPRPGGGLVVEVRLPAAVATVSASSAGVVQRQNISFPS